MINIALYQPEIPPNTGNIMRLAVNTGARLHLIKPLGFELEAKKLRRAGLDYREFALVNSYEDWEEFRQNAGENRIIGVTTKASQCYSAIQYQPGDFLLFGPETRGLPQSLRQHLSAENLVRIPMQPDSRSLNLSNAAAVVVYEAWRQFEFTGGE